MEMKGIDLYLIRHAQSLANCRPEYISGRSNDVVLSEAGIKQSETLKKRLELERLNFDRVYSSPAVRARETARISINENFVMDERLQELDQGEWVGRLRNEIYTPEILALINKDNHNFASPKGESQKEVGERMYDFVKDRVLGAPEGSKIAAFSHGVAIKCLLREIMQFDTNLTWRMNIENTSITQLRYHDNLWWPIRINDYAHLSQLQDS